MSLNIRRKSHERWKSDSELVVANARWINQVLSFGSVLVVASIARWFIEDLNIPGFGTVHLEARWQVACYTGLTAIHWYSASMFVDELRSFALGKSDSDCSALFVRLSRGGGVFMRGLKPRLPERRGGVLTVSIVDRPYWVSLFLAILLPVSVGLTAASLWWSLLGTALSLVNWSIGAYWSLVVSELTIRGEKREHLRYRTKYRFIIPRS